MAFSDWLLGDSWFWVLVVGAGLLLVLLELFLGVDTGLDLVFLGSAFILGGLLGWPFHSWLLTAIITGSVCVAYVVLGRRYIHRWTQVRTEKTNIDTIIGKRGVVLRSIAQNADGLARVGNESWRARAEEAINEGEEVEVVRVEGVTLVVRKNQGGGQR